MHGSCGGELPDLKGTHNFAASYLYDEDTVTLLIDATAAFFRQLVSLGCAQHFVCYFYNFTKNV